MSVSCLIIINDSKKKQNIDEIISYLKEFNCPMPIQRDNIIEQLIQKDSITDLSKNETKEESKTNSKELLNNNLLKEKIEDYIEENVITSNHYNYCFTQLNNSNIAIGYNSGSIGIYETKNVTQLIQINSRQHTLVKLIKQKHL